MQNYCKAYPERSFQQFSHWPASLDVPEGEERSARLYYLWDDFVVRHSPVRRDTVLLDTITPAWLTFCQEQLSFEVPETVAGWQAAASAAPEELAHKETVFFTSGQQWLIEELNSVDRFFHNAVIALPLLVPLPLPDFARIIAYLTASHDALRLRIAQVDGRWQQFLLCDDTTLPFTRVSAAHLSEDEQRTVMRTISLEMQQQINTLRGPLWYITYCETSSLHKGHLLFAINHFISDGISNEILFRDVNTLYQQTLRGKELRLPAKTTSFQQLALRLSQYLQTPEAQQELDTYWLSLPWQKARSLPLDFPEALSFDPQSLRAGYGNRASERTITVALGSVYTQSLLNRISNRYTQPLDLCLTALTLTLTAWNHSAALAIFVQDHGRRTIFEDVDLLHTVGYIAHTRRLLLDLTGTASPLEALEAVKKQLRQAPNNGRLLDWFLRRGDDLPIPESLRSLPRAEIHFNLHGNINNPVQENELLDAQLPMLEYPRSLRNHPLNCDVSFARGDMFFTWSYSESIHLHATVEAIIRQFITTLRNLIALLTPYHGIRRG